MLSEILPESQSSNREAPGTKIYRPIPVSEASPPLSQATRILGILSLLIGIIGTYFTIRSETTNEDSTSKRALYAFILALAGVLVEAARSSESTALASVEVEVEVEQRASPSEERKWEQSAVGLEIEMTEPQSPRSQELKDQDQLLSRPLPPAAPSRWRRASHWLRTGGIYSLQHGSAKRSICLYVMRFRNQ
jgi:hypothetical protein